MKNERGKERDRERERKKERKWRKGEWSMIKPEMI